MEIEDRDVFQAGLMLGALMREIPEMNKRGNLLAITMVAAARAAHERGLSEADAAAAFMVAFDTMRRPEVPEWAGAEERAAMQLHVAADSCEAIARACRREDIARSIDIAVNFVRSEATELEERARSRRAAEDADSEPRPKG